MNTEISLKDIEIPLEPTEEDIKLFGSKVHEVMLELSQADVKNVVTSTIVLKLLRKLDQRQLNLLLLRGIGDAVNSYMASVMEKG